MARITGAAITMLIAGGMAACGGTQPASEPVPPAADREGVLRYWPVAAGTTLRITGEREMQGEPASSDDIVFRSRGNALVAGKDVYEVEIASTSTASDGQASQGSITVYQFVDPDLSYTYAVQSGGGEPHVLQAPMTDLRSPLEAGTSWISQVMEGYAGVGVAAPIAMNFTSAIVSVGALRTVAGNEVGDCLEVVEAGVSVKDHPVVCADGQTRDAKILVDRTRWWCPDLGNVEETSAEAAVINSENDAPCREARSTHRLVAVSHDDGGAPTSD